jgi:CRISPR-associated endonuclease/helicase Cas3
MLRGQHPKNERTRHKQAGAARAGSARPDLAFAIAGHHGGLPDLPDLQELVKGTGGKDVAAQIWPQAVLDCPELASAFPDWQFKRDQALSFELAVRLLFSCLVDADWQDTGAFHRQSKGLVPEPAPLPLDPARFLEMTLAYIGERAQTCRDARIAAIRREVLHAAIAAAELPPGLFAMTVPTGGGKTLSALAFALSHARRNGMRRVIYVAPYLSIIEQNVREIRRALQVEEDSDLVFDHHSLAEPPGGQADEGESEQAARRAENWDAPVVVTTSVQFFESLFANKPGPCRKLHNIARSAVILDECQTLPPDLIKPTCSLLGHFARVAGCSIVLCTATSRLAR